MRVQLNWCVMAALVLLSPMWAQAQDVSVDYDQSFDFSTIATFAVQVATPANNPLAEQRVVAEIEEELVEKGWTKVEPEDADAIVLLHGATEELSQLNTFYSGYGAYGGWGWRGFGAGGTGTGTITETKYTVGTLVVDIYEAAGKQLVFRGIASDELSKKPDKNQKKVEKATAKMFKNFPPKTGE